MPSFEARSEKTNGSAADGQIATAVERLEAIGAAAVIRTQEPARLLRVAEALRAGGIEAIEVTMTVPNAVDMIETVDRELGDDVLLGVGSVLDASTAQRAAQAGARFVVSPVFKRELIQAAHEQGAAALPGCFTPTEVQAAWEAGADVVKVFPASVVGTPFVKALKAPLPHLKLMPTGGITLQNAGDWLRAGAVAVGVGSALLDESAIAEGRYEVLTDNARTLRRNLDAADEQDA